VFDGQLRDLKRFELHPLLSKLGEAVQESIVFYRRMWPRSPAEENRDKTQPARSAARPRRLPPKPLERRRLVTGSQRCFRGDGGQLPGPLEVRPNACCRFTRQRKTNLPVRMRADATRSV
jgi:hypothetical protein